MDDSTIKGLEQRYVVIRLDGKPAGPCFVLDPFNDKVALAALPDVANCYREAGYNALADDLHALRRATDQRQHAKAPSETGPQPTLPPATTLVRVDTMKPANDDSRKASFMRVFSKTLLFTWTAPSGPPDTLSGIRDWLDEGLAALASQMAAYEGRARERFLAKLQEAGLCYQEELAELRACQEALTRTTSQ